MPAQPHVATTRRTALGGALLVLGATAGCDLDPPARKSAGGRAPADQDSDTVLVADVLAELTGLTALVAAVGAKYPRLRSRMTDLRALHLAHRQELGDEPGAPAAFGGVLAGADEALASVRARERRAQNLLTDASVRAASGALARLLASMAAAVAQRQVALSTGSSGPSGAGEPG